MRTVVAKHIAEMNVVTLNPRRRPTSCSAGSQCTACELPTSATFRSAVVSPNSQVSRSLNGGRTWQGRWYDGERSSRASSTVGTVGPLMVSSQLLLGSIDAAPKHRPAPTGLVAAAGCSGRTSIPASRTAVTVRQAAPARRRLLRPGRPSPDGVVSSSAGPQGDRSGSRALTGLSFHGWA